MTPFEVEKLNRRFGAKARIAFRLDSCGFPVASLVCKYGAAEVSLYGAQVMTYRATGQGPVLFLSDKAVYEKGKAIRGGIPLCWPWFGRREGLPAHGFARTSMWRVLSTSYCDESVELTLGMTDTPESKEIFPYSFAVQLRINLGQSLEMELITRNAGIAPLPLSPAFHPYFRVMRLPEISIGDIDGGRYESFTDGSKGEISGERKIVEATDMLVYTPRNHAEINDPVLSRKIDITFSGAKSIVVWNPGEEACRAISDLDDEAYTRFVCVEPAISGKDAVTVKPGERHTLKMNIQPRLI